MQFRLADALLRAALIGVIGYYRRRWAGVGPFRGVRCTFEHCESCSAYGERMAREAPTARIAAARIRRRLNRCRELSLYRLPGGGLGWGSGYDGLFESPADSARPLLHDSLAADGENSVTRQAVDRAAADVLAAAGAAKSAKESAAGCKRLLLRDGAAVQRALTRRIRRRMTLAIIFTICGTLAWIGGFGAMPAFALLLVAILAIMMTASSRRLRQRLERMEVLTVIEPPRSDRLFRPVGACKSYGIPSQG